MTYRTRLVALALPLVLLAASGCASRADLAELRADVDALARGDGTRDGTATEALRTATLAREELGAVRETAEQAARDAAASRRMLEAMDARMGGTLGQGTLK